MQTVQISMEVFEVLDENNEPVMVDQEIVTHEKFKNVAKVNDFGEPIRRGGKPMKFNVRATLFSAARLHEKSDEMDADDEMAMLDLQDAIRRAGETLTLPPSLHARLLAKLRKLQKRNVAETGAMNEGLSILTRRVEKAAEAAADKPKNTADDKAAETADDKSED